MLTSHPLTNSFGVVIQREQIPTEASELKKYLIHNVNFYGVVLLKNMDLTPESYIKFGKLLGKIRPFVDEEYKHPEYPEIFVVSNTKRNGKRFGMDKVGYYWHSDSSFQHDPLPITMLYAQNVPTAGGETHFIDMSEAYEKLPNHLQNKLKKCTSNHEGAWKYIITEKDMGLSIEEIIRRDEKQLPPPEHPVVLTHPYTKNNCLYLSQGIARKINQFPHDESTSMVEQVWENILKTCGPYAHKWSEGDIIIWDNRRMVHRAFPSEDGSSRIMFRLGIEDGPFFTPEMSNI